MTDCMFRRLLAATLSAVLVLLSPGLEAPRLFAQAIGRAAPVTGVRVVTGLPAMAPSAALTVLPSPITMTPMIAAPSAIPAATVAVAPRAVTPAAALTATAKELAPQISAAAKTETGADSSRGAGQTIIDTLTGAKSAGTGAAPDVSAVEGSGTPALSAGLPASALSETPKPVVPAPAPQPSVKTVDSTISYNLHRFLLKSVAVLTGAVYSLPSAGPALTRKLIAQAADKRVVLSDYDDTLASFNQVLPQDMVSAVQAIKAAGKDFVVISDRTDEKRANMLTVFESLASLPVEVRAGMYVAANSGGRVYRYDENGAPVRVFDVSPLNEDQKAKIAAASAFVQAHLRELGTEIHVPNAANNSPSEVWNPYSYALMLKVGSSKESVLKAAEMFQNDLAARGMDIEVAPRFAKDPANPPYLNVSIVTKAPATAFIAKALGAEAKDVVIIGDNAYAPRRAKKDSWLTRLGERLSGGGMPATGNRTDANMETALPGALTLSVGNTGDPRASNLWVLDGKGPSVTLQVLMSVASKQRGAAKSSKTAATLGVVALLAAAAAGYYAMASAFGDIVSQGERMLRENSRDMIDGAMFLGTIVPSKEKFRHWLSAAKPFLAWLGAASFTVGVYALIYYAATHGKPAPKVTDAQVLAAAASAIMSKGMPWSHSEYSMGYSMALENLKKNGATDAQIELFKKLCDDATIKGGRFNSWSGD